MRPPRPARCRWRVAEQVGVHAPEGGGQGTAHFSGLERCASIWACPVCSAVIRAERASEIQRAVAAHQARGGGLVFLTLTIRHKRSDALAVGLDAILKAWQRMQQGKPWERFREQQGIKGSIRSIEVTHGSNGWHPHLHAIFFTEKPVTATELKKWESWIFERWARYVEKFGARQPTKLRGIDLRRADGDGQVIAQYLAKLQEHEEDSGVRKSGVGNEIARFDLKQGRKSGSVMPFELLDESRQFDDEGIQHTSALASLWWEYYNATKGRRAITWTRGLREDLLDDEEKTDEEILDEAERAPLRLLVPAEAWEQVKGQPAILAAALEALERGEIATAAYLLGGFEPDAETLAAAKRGEELPLTAVALRQGFSVVNILTGEVISPKTGIDLSA